MKKSLASLLLASLLATPRAQAWGQDSSFSRISVRASAFRLPEVGHIRDDWKPNTGVQVEIASNVARTELSLAVGHVSFDPLTGKPPFRETFFSLGWTAPVVQRGRAALSAGVRLSDVLMKLEDPTTVVALRTEEETLIAGIARAHVALGRGLELFADGSYGVFMLSTKSPTAMVNVGVGRTGQMPGWLRNILR